MIQSAGGRQGYQRSEQPRCANVTADQQRWTRRGRGGRGMQ